MLTYLVFASVLTGLIIFTWWSGQAESGRFYKDMRDVHNDLQHSHIESQARFDAIMASLDRIHRHHGGCGNEGKRDTGPSDHLHGDVGVH